MNFRQRKGDSKSRPGPSMADDNEKNYQYSPLTTPLLPPSPDDKSTTTSSSSSSSAASRFSLLAAGIVLLQIGCEVSKQISIYSVQYYNAGKYPLPQTAIVVVMEAMKLVATIVRAKGSIPSFSSSSLRSSLRFLMPSLLYALNNNIYFIGLTLVPPPIWLILCSMRTAITASIYKFFLKRPLTLWQFVGAFMIVMSIIIAKLPDIMGTGSKINAVPVSAILLAVVASTNSVGAAVYTETLFKSGSVKGETFMDQQFWLYLYGIFVSGTVHLFSNPHYGGGSLIGDVGAMTDQIFYLLLFATLVGSVGGLVVAAILKLLDNIVKEYSGSVANVLTAILCSYIFPDKFQFTIFIVMSLSFLLTGIYLYETKRAVVPSSSSNEAVCSNNRTGEVKS